MLLPLIRRLDQGPRELPAYSRWAAITSELRAVLEEQPELPLARLVEFLDGVESDCQAGALQDLIAEHLRFTWARGAGVPLEVYVEVLGKQFDALSGVGVLPLELIEDEFLARHALPGGDAPPIAKYERRFPGREDLQQALLQRLLAGRYVKLQRLGRGATGEVWEARDLEAGRLVAIKQLRPEWLGNEAALSHFAEEAGLIERLDHPGIVRAHDFVQERGSLPYLVLELVRGRPLNELIADHHFPKVCRTRRVRRADREQLLDIFEALCGAVAHAHARGVLHRDLKPGNVVVERGGRAVILDWGLAVDVGASGASESAGTPESMAPEQARGAADERSDVFGLGAILHELLTGHPPRSWADGKRPAEWQRAVLEEPLVLPRRLGAACRQALAAEPAERLPSAEELLAAFRRQRARSAWTRLFT